MRIVIIFYSALCKRMALRDEPSDRTKHGLGEDATVPLVLPKLCVDMFSDLGYYLIAITPNRGLGEIVIEHNYRRAFWHPCERIDGDQIGLSRLKRFVVSFSGGLSEILKVKHRNKCSRKN